MTANITEVSIVFQFVRNFILITKHNNFSFGVQLLYIFDHQHFLLEITNQKRTDKFLLFDVFVNIAIPETFDIVGL